MEGLISQILRASTPSFLNPGATGAAIAGFEAESGLPLPADYRRFLSLADGGEIFVPDFTLYGIGGKWNLSAANTHRIRESYRLSPWLYVIGNLSFGDLFCLDVRNGAVVEWDSERFTEVTRWESFRALLEDMIRDEKTPL